MIESAGMAAQVQAKSLFRAFKIPSGSRFWSARNPWACYALNRTATSSANVGDESPFERSFETVLQSPIPFLNPGYVKTKHQDKLRSGNERRRPRPPLLCKRPRKPKKNGERDTKYKSGTLRCLPYVQFR